MSNMYQTTWIQQTKSKKQIEVVIGEDDENIEPVETPSKKKRGQKAVVKRGPYKKTKE